MSGIDGVVVDLSNETGFLKTMQLLTELKRTPSQHEYNILSLIQGTLDVKTISLIVAWRKGLLGTAEIYGWELALVLNQVGANFARKEDVIAKMVLATSVINFKQLRGKTDRRPPPKEERDQKGRYKKKKKKDQ